MNIHRNVRLTLTPYSREQIVKRRMAGETLGNHDLRATFIHLFNNPVGVKRLVHEQGIEPDVLEQRRNTDSVMTLPRQKLEAHEIAKRIRQGQDFRRQAAF